jgi:glycosyltransferase involved in cell wall biosynthesis
MSLCLVMIIKNEAKNLERLLNSIKSIINSASILDTGSTDNSKEILKKWFIKNNKKLNLHTIPFLNFGYNRTMSFIKARQAFPNTKYFLLSDADFIWKVDNFDINELTGDKILVKQKNKTLSYYNFRILSNKNFFCAGVTHEIWMEREKVNVQTISSLEIDDIEDGGCKSDKFIRDELLLRDGLGTCDPFLRSRYKFYLSQTLQDLQKYEDAIMWYHERVKEGGFPEEVFFSYFQIGRCYHSLFLNLKIYICTMGKYKKNEDDLKIIERYKKYGELPSVIIKKSNEFAKLAYQYFLKSHEFYPKRSEGLLHAIVLNISMFKYDDALELIKKGKEIPYPNGDILFINDSCYQYMFDVCLCEILLKQKKYKECIKEMEKENVKDLDMIKKLKKGLPTQ